MPKHTNSMGIMDIDVTDAVIECLSAHDCECSNNIIDLITNKMNLKITQKIELRIVGQSLGTIEVVAVPLPR